MERLIKICEERIEKDEWRYDYQTHSDYFELLRKKYPETVDSVKRLYDICIVKSHDLTHKRYISDAIKFNELARKCALLLARDWFHYYF